MVVWSAWEIVFSKIDLRLGYRAKESGAEKGAFCVGCEHRQLLMMLIGGNRYAGGIHELVKPRLKLFFCILRLCLNGIVVYLRSVVRYGIYVRAIL